MLKSHRSLCVSFSRIGAGLCILLLLLLFLASFSHPGEMMVFHCSLSDNRFPQVSRILLSILVYLNNTVVWMVSARHPISNSSNPLFKSKKTVPSAPLTIGITVTFMFHSFFSSLARSKYMYLFLFCFLWFSHCDPQGRQSPPFGSFSLLIISWSSLLASIRWSISILKPQRILRVSFSQTDSGFCIYHLVVWPNFNCFHDSQWITFPPQLCLV